MLILTICSSAFAECKLDMNRWKHMVTNNNCACYFDTVSLDVNNDNSSFEVWECMYFPGNYSKCTNRTCIEKGWTSIEHYHYVLSEYNYKHRTNTTKRLIVRDSNENDLLSYEWPLHLQKAEKLVPNSYVEFFMVKIKEYIDNTTGTKTGIKEEPVFPIVINNTKKDEVKRQLYQAFRELIATPDFSNLNPTISEDNEKISIKSFWKNKGISFEECGNVFVIQNGKDVIVNGESTVTSHYPDGKTVGPTRNAKADIGLGIIVNNVKKNINGYYRFGYSYNNKERYYVITKVVPGYPFEKKGIKAGDILISINGNQLKGLSKMELYTKKILDPFSPEEKNFEIKHNGETKQYTIKPRFVSPEELKKETKS